jgi:hypothetical protein
VVKIAQTLLERRWKFGFGGGRDEEGTDLRCADRYCPEALGGFPGADLMLKTRRALMPPILV